MHLIERGNHFSQLQILFASNAYSAQIFVRKDALVKNWTLWLMTKIFPSTPIHLSHPRNLSKTEKIYLRSLSTQQAGKKKNFFKHRYLCSFYFIKKWKVALVYVCVFFPPYNNLYSVIKDLLGYPHFAMHDIFSITWAFFLGPFHLPDIPAKETLWTSEGRHQQSNGKRLLLGFQEQLFLITVLNTAVIRPINS